MQMRPWPYTNRKGLPDISPVFDLSISEIENKLINKVFMELSTNYMVKTYRVCKVDKPTSLHLYGKVYYPVAFIISRQRPLQPLKFFKCKVIGPDDTSLTATYYDLTGREARSLRSKMYRYFFEHKLINGADFEAYARSLDPNVDWDTN